MQLIVFVAIMLTIVGLLHWYLWRRLVRDTTRPGGVRRAGTVVAVGLTLLMPATLIAARMLEPAVARWPAWPGYVWIGLFFYLLIGTLVLELPRWIALRVLRRRHASEALVDASVPGASVHGAAGAGPSVGTAPSVGGDSPDDLSGDLSGAEAPLISRRLLVARSSAALIGVAAVGVVGYGMATALGGPRITPVTVPLAKLPAGLDGLRIGVVSDIHLGPLLGRAHTERIVSMINEQRVDLVTIVGDLVDGSVDELGEAAAPLRDLTSTHGSFFVTGNHEYFSGAQQWIDELARLGVTPLLNERTEIRSGGDPAAVLDLAGVNDVSADEGNEPDFDRALGGRDVARPVILLAHQPVQIDDAAQRGVDLQLSGHTHGGQMFPFHGIVRMEQPVLSGLHTIGGTQLFVTRGAGFWGPPVRIGAPPEIAVVRLTTSR